LRLVFLGVPGAGKGTQAARLVQRLGAPHVSTGEMLRETAREDTPLARKLKEYMDSGGLVPDEMMNQVVEARLSRPDAQAEALGATLSRMKKKLDAVVFFNLPQGEAVKRLSGRRTCSSCGANYHVSFNPPMREGTCDNCGAKLYQRDDDKPEVIERRFEAYQERTSGLVVYYRAKGLLREVNASPGPDEIFSSVLDVLGLGE
jgi:adenylate kinase